MGYLAWENLGSSVKIVMNQLHYCGLIFMILAYTFRVYQLFQIVAAQEGTPPRGDHKKAIQYSYLIIAMPWEVESQKQHMYRYIEFVIFHIGIATGISFALIVPFAHEVMKNPLICILFQLSFTLSFSIGISRLLRRIFQPEMRRISSPDDYFCLILLTIWMFLGVFAAPLKNETWLFSYYALETFFLFYAPFSKISHYVYFFFNRYYIGKHFGHRGTYPKKKDQGKCCKK